MTAEVRLSPAGLRALAVTPGWPRHLVALGSLAAAILLLFLHDAADMVRIWWTSSTYGHCIFIPFLIGWLVHQRVDGLRLLRPAAWTAGLIWIGAGTLLWLLGDAAGLAVLRHGGVIMMLQGAVAACLGPIVTRSLLFPLFYAFFMVPVGSELEPALQLLTARIAMPLLGLAGVPAHIEGIFITTPTGYFRVAEACSGAKFLVAMTAYGVLACNVCFRSWVRRAIFLAGSLIICLIANGVRAFATIYVAHLTTVDAAVGFDHVVYGWLFFAFVMAVIMLAAWPFFDRRPGDQSFDPRLFAGATGTGKSLSVMVAAAMTILIAAPAWSHVSALRGQAEPAVPRLPDIPGWHRTAMPPRYPWKPRFEGADRFVQARYMDERGQAVDLVIVAYARQAEGRELIGFGQGAADPSGNWVWSAPAWAPDGARGETITAPGPVERHVVTFFRVGQSPLMGMAADVKLATMRARLLMQDQQAVAILISAEQGDGVSADTAIRRFLSALGRPEDLADTATGTS